MDNRSSNFSIGRGATVAMLLLYMMGLFYSNYVVGAEREFRISEDVAVAELVKSRQTGMQKEMIDKIQAQDVEIAQLRGALEETQKQISTQAIGSADPIKEWRNADLGLSCLVLKNGNALWCISDAELIKNPQVAKLGLPR